MIDSATWSAIFSEAQRTVSRAIQRAALSADHRSIDLLILAAAALEILRVDQTEAQDIPESEAQKEIF